MTTVTTPRSVRRTLRGACRIAAAAGLAVDAYVHAKLADQYDAVSATISQGTLFRVEAGLAALAALLVLIWRRSLADAFAWLVAAGGLAALILYRYVDIGALGPLPDMYEPIWSDDKKLSVAAQFIAMVATTVLLLTHRFRAKPAPTLTPE
ncbi:hypothetical protein QMK19_39250 [Streptomyces sp. H10-C2]|uniref:hypothetical protein n=1 Tax=unclassified Streptomyces TaxID=2593676 RepID=UPI0024BACAED|nr:MULTISPECIES: hypothetical protein [unclassified Streptomyces]MDJ0347237.1 hypothetical protein [Streptomyces sp. PH10-H1]MDJ0375472.1 hypothetical protein [Streptomyces sp. H10-C2]